MASNLKRRAVFHVLSDIASGPMLIEIMLQWERQFTRQAPHSIPEFIDYVYCKVQPQQVRTAVIRKLTASLLDPQAANWHDPTQTLKANLAKNSKLAIVSGDVKPFLVFKTSLYYMSTELNQEAYTRLKFALSRSLSECDLSLRNRHEISLWLKDNSNILPIITTAEAQSLIHQAYQLFCEHLGPVKADQCLSRAVDKTDQLLDMDGFAASILL